jgi:hypothetical protein
MINKLLCVLLVSSFILVFACEKTAEEQLLEMQKKWNAQDFSSYNYVVSKQCFCSPDYTREMLVSVVNNRVTDAQYVDTQERVSRVIVEQLTTISQWFDEISLATENELSEVEVFYDNELGHPTSIRIDKHKKRSDDEFNVLISSVIKQ